MGEQGPCGKRSRSQHWTSFRGTYLCANPGGKAMIVRLMTAPRVSAVAVALGLSATTMTVEAQDETRSPLNLEEFDSPEHSCTWPLPLTE